MQGTENYPLFFIVSSLVILAFVGIIILFVLVYQRRLMKQELNLRDQEQKHQHDRLLTSIETEEKERHRIARDLHDELGASLSTVKMKIGQAKRKYKDQTDNTDVLDEAEELLRDSIATVRNISHDLLPPVLERFGLEEALRNHISAMQTDAGPKVEFSSHGIKKRLSPGVELCLYRSILELLNNAVKHANASKIDLRITYDSHYIEIDVNDNGIGFDYSNKNMTMGGLGLKSVKNRLFVIGAKLQIQCPDSGGTHIKIIMDYENSLS